MYIFVISSLTNIVIKRQPKLQHTKTIKKQNTCSKQDKYDIYKTQQSRATFKIIKKIIPRKCVFIRHSQQETNIEKIKEPINIMIKTARDNFLFLSNNFSVFD